MAVEGVYHASVSEKGGALQVLIIAIIVIMIMIVNVLIKIVLVQVLPEIKVVGDVPVCGFSLTSSSGNAPFEVNTNLRW